MQEDDWCTLILPRPDNSGQIRVPPSSRRKARLGTLREQQCGSCTSTATTPTCPWAIAGGGAVIAAETLAVKVAESFYDGEDADGAAARDQMAVVLAQLTKAELLSMVEYFGDRAPLRERCADLTAIITGVSA